MFEIDQPLLPFQKEEVQGLAQAFVAMPNLLTECILFSHICITVCN